MMLYFIYSLGIGLIVGNTMTCAMSYLPINLQADGNAVLETLMQLSGGNRNIHYSCYFSVCTTRNKFI